MNSSQRTSTHLTKKTDFESRRRLPTKKNSTWWSRQPKKTSKTPIKRNRCTNNNFTRVKSVVATLKRRWVRHWKATASRFRWIAIPMICTRIHPCNGRKLKEIIRMICTKDRLRSKFLKTTCKNLKKIFRYFSYHCRDKNVYRLITLVK